MITNSGQRLGQRYVLRERLAVGGMGEVWSALDEQLNRDVAVKVLRTDLAPDPAFQTRFRAEARTAAALSHGGIAAVFDYGESGGAAYLVMELVPGEPLSAMIANEGALGTDRTLQIVSQAARALHAAHRHGVIHRDIKPANLMVTPELRVKVTDFGIARPRDHEPLTATGQVMGTAHYLAPELARGEIASPLSDVYALGVVAYECLAGWRPFDGDNQVAVATAHLQDEPPPLPATVPAPVRAIVEQAMAKDPAKRPQGANVLAAIMEDARLRGLAARGGARPQPVQPAWPADAATPPRGAHLPGSRPGPAVPASASGFGEGYEAPPPGYGQGHAAQRPPQRRDQRPDQRRGERPAARDGSADHRDGNGQGRRLGPETGSSRRDGDRTSGGRRLGPETGSSRRDGDRTSGGRRLGPETSVIPAGLRRARGGRLSVPLAALLVLIVLVVIGSLVARSRDSSLPRFGPVTGSVRAATTESGFGPPGGAMMAQQITTEGWNW